MARRRVLWASTSTRTQGGVATYVVAMQHSPLWTDWDIRHVATHRDGSALAKLLAFVGGATLFVIELIRFRPNVIHLHSSAGASFIRKCILFWIAQLGGVPTIVHMHGSRFTEYYADSAAPFRAFIRATLRRAGAVVALGEAWGARLRIVAPSANVVVIPNGVSQGDPVAQPEDGEPVQIVFLGRIGDHKGTFVLLDAWAKLARELETLSGRPRAALTIAGDGEVERARRCVEDLDLEETVTVHGWLPHHEVDNLLDRGHVLVLPSRNEGQPMAVLEAMARGLCVIATGVGGLTEMIGDGCGVIVPPDDVEELVAALREAVFDDDERERYGAAAYRRIQTQFDSPIVAQQVDALYRELIR
jgi:glycosyltransferase involved in cell wall biosynthesis